MTTLFFVALPKMLYLAKCLNDKTKVNKIVSLGLFACFHNSDTIEENKSQMTIFSSPLGRSDKLSKSSLHYVKGLSPEDQTTQVISFFNCKNGLLIFW